MYTSPISIKSITIDNAAELLNLSKKTFFDAFAPINNAADMEEYALKAFTLQQIKDEINCLGSFFYFALSGESIAGYLKINFSSAQTELQDENAMEVERIYVLQQYQGTQVGKQLLNFAIQTALQKQLHYIWLGVWQKNYKAIRFYESNGFKVFGSHNFSLGNDLQTDLLMKKEL